MGRQVGILFPLMFSWALLSCEREQSQNSPASIGEQIQCDADVVCDGQVGLLEITEKESGVGRSGRTRLCTAFIDQRKRLVSSRACLPELLTPGSFSSGVRVTYHSPTGDDRGRAYEVMSWDYLGRRDSGPFNTQLISLQMKDLPNLRGLNYANWVAPGQSPAEVAVGIVSEMDDRGVWRHRLMRRASCQRQSESTAFPFSVGPQHAAIVFSNCQLPKGFLGAPVFDGDGAITGVIQGSINPEVTRTHLAQNYSGMIAWNSRFVREMPWASSTACLESQSGCTVNPLIRELLHFPGEGIYFPPSEWQRFSRLMEMRLSPIAGLSGIQWAFEVNRRQDSTGKIGFEIIPIPHCYFGNRDRVPSHWRGDLPILRTRYILNEHYQPLPGAHSEAVGSFELKVMTPAPGAAVVGVAWSIEFNDLSTRQRALSLSPCQSHDADARFSVPWVLPRPDREEKEWRSAWNRLFRSRKDLLQIINH